MDIKRRSVIQSLNWDVVLALGVSQVYYNIDSWLTALAYDSIARDCIKKEHENLTTIWRSLFLRSLHDWSFETTGEKIADCLSLRCFVRANDLLRLTPTGGELKLFLSRNEKGVTNLFRHIAVSRMTDRRPTFNVKWANMLDGWAERIIATA